MKKKLGIVIMLIILALAMIPAQSHHDRYDDHHNWNYSDHYGNSQPNNGYNGYTGPNDSIITVEQALKLADDSWVILQGTIEKSLGGGKYQFRDSTGTVVLDIDSKLWAGQSISEKDTVVIYGEIDKDNSKTEIDVDRIVKK